MDKTTNIEQFKRYQVIFLRKTHSNLSAKDVAEICSISKKIVIQWTYLYNKFDTEKYILKG